MVLTALIIAIIALLLAVILIMCVLGRRDDGGFALVQFLLFGIVLISYVVIPFYDVGSWIVSKAKAAWSRRS
ncbi:hypothetical protein [Ktedonospora formicarum]|uniref:Uncharacterized protein n=1 Tax=Ktedonospora formicarum TaxID=2778364 RepID=A0A8J3MTD3_9CHLR|nr:hypothetical protein [Ktedonospora formicarum]GHO44240.1 hypothetical protein KSX_24030 [Ktedonospora formicarum]